MNRNPRDKHLKRINAPKHWLLDKLSGVWAPRPSAGPHKLRECMPIVIMLRNRLKYALTAREVKMIVSARHIRIDGKVRTDTKFPCGLMDVVTINRTGEHFRLIYDTKGRFHLTRIPVSDANWKLLKVTKKAIGSRGIPYIVTHDGRTIPYPNPAVKINDTIQYDFIKGKIEKIFPFDLGTVIMVVGGRNVGRVGVLEKMEKHPGAFDIVYIRDKSDHVFATRKNNVFIIGKGTTPSIPLPKLKGIKLGVVEDRELRMKRQRNPLPNQNDKKKYAGKGKLLPPHVAELRMKTQEKKRLLKILRQQEKAAGGKGKGKGKKKAKKAAE